MKIAHICLSLGKGGAEKLLVDNLPYYIAQGHDITIIQLSTIHEEPSYIATVLKAGIKVINLSNGGFLNPLIFWKMIRVIKKNKFDILHVHLFPCLYYASLASRLIRKFPVLVFTEHSTVNRRITKKYFQPLEHFIYKKYDSIIAISENVELLLKKWLPRLTGKIKTINNGVNIERFASATGYDNDYFQENFAVNKTDVKLLMASRFIYYKDQGTLLKSLTYLPANFHAFFAGEGNDLEKMKELATSLNIANRAHFLGFRTDMPELMRSADVNVLSSFYEGLSGVTLEALASGKPFLGSDVPGINDIVPNKNFLFKKQDAKDLADKLLAITSDQSIKERMLAEAVEQVSKFDARTMFRLHIELYEQLLNEKARRKASS